MPRDVHKIVLHDGFALGVKPGPVASQQDHLDSKSAQKST
jgi:hypothetical protein